MNEICWRRCILQLFYIIPLSQTFQSTSLIGEIILDTCMKFESHPKKMLEGDRFWRNGQMTAHTDRRADYRHRMMGKAQAEIVSWAQNISTKLTYMYFSPLVLLYFLIVIFEIFEVPSNRQKLANRCEKHKLYA